MSTKPKRTKAEAKQRPALHIQVGGVRIAIWKNEGKDGPYFKAGKPELFYKDNDGNWQLGKSYGDRDLINLIKVAALAHSEVIHRNRKEPSAPSAAEDTADTE